MNAKALSKWDQFSDNLAEAQLIKKVPIHSFLCDTDQGSRKIAFQVVLAREAKQAHWMWIEN